MMDLDRFLTAQAPVYEGVLSELRAGRKKSHWMWFIFPQLRGLGFSSTAQYFAISGLEEARAYLDHAVLGHRLRECFELVGGLDGTAEEIFGFPDNLKLRSSATLFVRAAGDNAVFVRVLDRFFGGEPDARTLQLLENT